jgi:hypothetical protein
MVHILVFCLYEIVLVFSIVYIHMPKRPVQFLSKIQQWKLRMLQTPLASFSMGVNPIIKKSKRKQSLYDSKPKSKPKRRITVRPEESLFQKQSVRVIPCSKQLCFSIDMLKGKTHVQKMTSLQAMKPHIYVCAFWKETSTLTSVASKLATIKKECKEYLLKNQICRWRLKRFLTLWRLRHLRQLNDVDPITLSPFEQPIIIVSFPTRGKYVFEASSFVHEIHQKLLRSDGQIPTPVFPRNPLTNQNLTYGQLVSVYNQCLKYGRMKWTFQGLYHARFSLPLFLTLYRKSLRVNAVKTILNTYDNYDGMDMLIDFIERQHEEHESPCNLFIYRWSICHLPNERRINQWREFCRSWYEKDILLEEQTEKQAAFARIQSQTMAYCNPPNELIAKRQFLLNKKKESHHV